MKKTIGVLSCLVALIITVLYACQSSAAKEANELSTSDTALIQQGEYLVTAMGCDDCHSPKRMGPAGPELIPELRLSGFDGSNKMPPVDTNAVKNGWVLLFPDLTSAVGPWGASYAANLTSDSTGIGGWTEAQFFRAIREGKWKGLESSRPLLPPMPWQNYAKLKDNDLKAIFAFLKSTQPVKNVVPAPKPLSALQ